MWIKFMPIRKESCIQTRISQRVICQSHMLSIQRQTNRRSRLAHEPTTIEQSVSAESVGRDKDPSSPLLYTSSCSLPIPAADALSFSARSWRSGASSAAGTRFTHRFTRSRAPPAGSPNTRRHDSPPFRTENVRLHWETNRFVGSFNIANALRAPVMRLRVLYRVFFFFNVFTTASALEAFRL